MKNMKSYSHNIRIEKYCDTNRKMWDEFVKTSRTPIFMFCRNYMEYHSDRFVDYSLFLYYKDELAALFPANIKENTLESHGGLTYGGFIVNDNMKQHIMNDCIHSLIDFCRDNNIHLILYKAVPHFLHVRPCEEDIFGLYHAGASVCKIEPSTLVSLSEPSIRSDERKRAVKKAINMGVEVRELYTHDDYRNYMEIVKGVLISRHNAMPVHTADELFLLKNNFPNNIHLIGGFLDGKMISGVVLYEYLNAVHTQYLAADEESRKCGGLDIVVDYAIKKYKGKKEWFDFGISTEGGGQYLNEGLIRQKEGFGGRTNVYVTWEIKLG